jgi:NAD(P)H-quinone oxidoreductase subunit 5
MPVLEQLPSTVPAWPSAALLVPALVVAAAAVLAARAPTVATAWRSARTATSALAIAAVVVAVARLAGGVRANGLVRIDNVTVAMVGLVALVGWVVVRFSASYLAGDPHEQRYAARILATLAAVSVVVVANHVVLLLAAWTATSVALHGLLTFFGDRPVAVAVAHKKFLLARFADACMFGAAVAFWVAWDTLRIDAIGAQAAAGALPTSARVGIMLVALAVIVKCAQLPFHGWLIQVMEAPTPVSALLHAGVVNLGGFVLLRFAPVVDQSVETRGVLLAVGLFTAVVAALVMTTRVSIKVALAWSTCAQMGFMLVQCALGLWEMALLHLLAHSAYKAHAFLGAGGTVRRVQRQQLAGHVATPGLAAVLAGLAVSLAATVVVGLAWQALPGTKQLSAPVWVMLGVVALAIVPLTAGAHRGSRLVLGARSIAVTVLYLGLHELAGEVVPHGTPVPAAFVVVTGLAFATLFALQTACLVAPTGPVAQRIRPWVYAGLFLDDAFTRVAFAVSPPPPAVARPTQLPQSAAVAVVRTPAHVAVAR